MISISVRALPLLLALLASETNAQPRVNYTGNCVDRASNCPGNPTAAVASTHFNGSFQVSSQADLNNYVNSMVLTVNTQVNTVVQKVNNYNAQRFNHVTQLQAEASVQGAEVKTEWDKLGVMVQEGGIISRMIQNSTTGFNSYVAGQAAQDAVIGSPGTPARIGTAAGGANLLSTISFQDSVTSFTFSGSAANASGLPTEIRATGRRGSGWGDRRGTWECRYTVVNEATLTDRTVNWGNYGTDGSLRLSSATLGGSAWTDLSRHGCPDFAQANTPAGRAMRWIADHAVNSGTAISGAFNTLTNPGRTAVVPTTNASYVAAVAPTIATPARAAIAEVLGNAFVKCGASIIGGTCTND